MNTSLKTDPFHPDHLQIEPVTPPVENSEACGPTQIWDRKTQQFVPAIHDPLSGVDRSADKAGFEYCGFPRWVMDRLLSLNNPKTALAVLVCLYEIYFRDLEHRNPIKLTTFKLKKYGISKDQKARALKNLERLKIVSVERKPRKNPEVLFRWLLPR